MKPLTFSAACQYIKEADPKLLAAVDALLSTALLLGPTILGMPPEVVGAAVSLIGAKNELIKLGKTVYTKLVHSEPKDSIQRQDRMEAAFTVICYTSFFDSISKIAPEINKIINLNDADKIRLANSAVKTANENTCDVSTSSQTSDFVISLPHPAESLDQITSRLTPLYVELTKGVLRLVEAFQAWESLADKKRKEVIDLCQKLPKLAAGRFRAQYFDLSSRYNDFAVWTNLREHAATHGQLEALSKAAKILFNQLAEAKIEIDLGLQDLRREIQGIPKAIVEYHAATVWKDLERQYQNAVQEPIIKDPAGIELGKPTLHYPAKSEIFVPQSFKVLRYTNGTHLEHEDTWRKLPVRRDLGEFLLAYLNSPYSLETPLVVLGHPGSGKSLLSQMIAAQTISNAFAPIRLELRSIDADNEIEAQIEEQIRADIARTISFSALMDSLAGRPAIVIFDGYDELLQATGQVFAGYLTKVQKFQERESLTLERNPVRTIVTSRITLIDKALIPEGATVLRLLEFDQMQQKKWIEVWNHANQSYFVASRIQPFSLPTAPKLAPLAEQPLLLLMLALYDSSQNQLHHATTLDQTVLYDSLLRRFIERERMKDSDFRLIKNREREAEIEKDMDRLGVAAVGMFNRHSLHIRATQLNGDIVFFGSERHTTPTSGRALSQAELILGSFFFVHQSKSEHKGEHPAERDVDTAFEFLHNTFGEFLTGYFIVRQILKETNKLFKLRIDADLASHRARVLSEPDGLADSWYVTLMYASLLPRPIIVTMLREWFPHAVGRSGRKREDILQDLDDIISHEVRRTLAARQFPSVMTHKETSFDTLPLVGCLANYTLNLITLRVALSSGEYFFDEQPFRALDRRPRVWDRLTFFWRSWFSADALNALSAIFTAERTGDQIRLHMCDNVALPAVAQRLDTILNVAMAVADNVGIALTGLALHDPFKRQAVTIERIRAAAECEQLQLEGEILRRELWDAARIRVSESRREELQSACTELIERNGIADIGTSVDIVRAFGQLDDRVRFRSLVMRLYRQTRSPSFRFIDVASSEAVAGVMALLADVDRRLPYSSVELLGHPPEKLEDFARTLRELPPDGAFAVARWALRTRTPVDPAIVEALDNRAQDQDFISSISPRVAVDFIRTAWITNRREFDAVVERILEYYLNPEQVFGMKPESAARMLELAQRSRFRHLLKSFCSRLPSAFNDSIEDRWAMHHVRLPLRRFDVREPDRGDFGVVLLQVVSKFGDDDVKQFMYRYALERWWARGYSRLTLAVIRYSRLIDDGALMLRFTRSEHRFVISDRSENEPGPLAQSILRLDIGQVPVESLKDLVWYGNKVEDGTTVAKVKQILDNLTDI